MNKTNLFTLGTFALTTLLGSVSSHAAHWDMMNNPNGFNSDWHRTNYTSSFDKMPTSGTVPTEQTPWGDSYWPKNRGAFSYRWHEFQESGASQSLTVADRDRLFFKYKLYDKKEISRMSRDQLAMLSPFEKYSIVIGDFNYKLVQEYRNKNSADDAYWEGYCHAWSAASAHYTEPMPVDVDVMIEGKRVTVPFGTGDVKALLTANYADLDGWSNVSAKLNKFKRVFNKNTAPKVEIRYVGNMCHRTFTFPVTKIKNGLEVMTDYSDTDGVLDTEIEALARKYQEDVKRVYAQNPKGVTAKQLADANNPLLAQQARLDSQDPSCSDTNAGAFHIVMSNQLGIMNEGFLMDKTRDGEVWNQPIYKFDTRVVGEESPNSNSAPGTVKMVEMDTNLYYADDTDYGWTFWNPSLSGMFGLKDYFTSFMDEYNKYQNMLIKEGDLDVHAEYPEHVLASAHYRYKLELDRNNKIIGGQWITLDRPDDLYFVKKSGFVGSFSELGKIYRPLRVNSSSNL
jgi:hypothetical protein